MRRGAQVGRSAADSDAHQPRPSRLVACHLSAARQRHLSLSNLVTVLSLTDQGRIKCSEKMKRPSAASNAIPAASLDGGDFYDSAVNERIAAFA
jgi:hypothetical protein